MVSSTISGPCKIDASVLRASAFAGRVGRARRGDNALADGKRTSRGTEARTCRSAPEGGEFCHLDDGKLSASSSRASTASMIVDEARK